MFTLNIVDGKIQPPSTATMFRTITFMTDMGAINFLIETFIGRGMSAADFLAMSAIYEAQTLDERHSLAYAKLGAHAQAVERKLIQGLTHAIH